MLKTARRKLHLLKGSSISYHCAVRTTHLHHFKSFTCEKQVFLSKKRKSCHMTSAELASSGSDIHLFDGTVSLVWNSLLFWQGLCSSLCWGIMSLVVLCRLLLWERCSCTNVRLLQRPLQWLNTPTHFEWNVFNLCLFSLRPLRCTSLNKLQSGCRLCSLMWLIDGWVGWCLLSQNISTQTIYISTLAQTAEQNRAQLPSPPSATDSSCTDNSITLWLSTYQP